MSTPAPAAPTKKTASLTAYRVLKFPEPPAQNSARGGMEQGYKDVGGTNASSAQGAIRQIAEKTGAGTYVAVPESSWKPVTVTIETQTVIKLGGSVA